MSFVPGDLVWAQFDIWHPGMVGTPDQLPPKGQEGQIPVIFGDGSGCFLDPHQVESLETNTEERKNAEGMTEEIWSAFKAMVRERQGGDDDSEEEEENRKAHLQEWRKARKSQKRSRYVKRF